MLASLKVFALAGSPPHWEVALGLLAYAIIEFWLGRTKLVQSNSTLELGANVAKKFLLDRIPLIGRLIKAMATPALVVLFVATTVTGCATSATKPGATLTDKLKDDMAALKQVEVDVKTQCGDQFAPLAVQAGMVLSIAYAVASAAAGDVAGAVHQALGAFPTLVGDMQGLVCVEKVLVADYKKLKPQKVAPAPTADRAMELALAQVCDNAATRGSALCRPITCDTDEDACLGVMLSTGRAVKVQDKIVFLDKDGEPRVASAQ